MIRTLRVDGRGECTRGGEEQIALWQQDSDSRIWIDLCGGDPQAEEQTLLALGCHPLAVKDALRERHPPKLEEFPDFTFILYRGIAHFDDELNHQGQPIAFFVGQRCLITRHPQSARSIERLYTEDGEHFLAKGSTFLVLRIMHLSAGIYLDNLLAFEGLLSDLEDNLLQGGNDQHMRELVAYRSRLVKLRRMFNYHKNITDELRSGDYQMFPEEEALSHVITDLHDRFERLHSLAQMFYELCGDLVDAYISITSHQLNSTMRVLTVITAIFVPLSFLAGLYGMNFDYIPELKIENGYFILLGVMGVLSAALIWMFRRMRWL